jgi:hypothetical protein
LRVHVKLGLRRADGHVCFAFVIGVGASWRLVIASAGWAGRWAHTSVIDAAGAIYVIGGRGFSGTHYQDVWVSTDGGAQAGLAPGVLRGTKGTKALSRVLRVLAGQEGVTRVRGYSRGTMGNSQGTSRYYL